MPSGERLPLRSPLVLRASLGACLCVAIAGCGAAAEPARVATVSTEAPPSATASAEPIVTPIAETATPVTPDAPEDTASPASSAKSTPAEESSIKGQLDSMSADMLLMLLSTGGSSTGTGTLSLGSSAGSGGAIAGLSSGSNAGLSGVGGVAGGPSVGTAAAQVKGPVANVSISSPTVSGGAVSNASRVVAGMAAGFRRCANRALSSDPTSVKSGTSLVVRATIGANGEVTAAKPLSSKGIAAPLASCVTARVSAAQFAPPDGGSSRIDIPILFKVDSP